MEWLGENVPQHVQWQNGEQSSWCGSFCWWADFFTTVVALLSLVPLSAQGIMLSAKTSIAIMKAKNFIECKCKPSILLIAHQKL